MTFFCSGDKPPQDAQDYKDELNRITKYITDLDAQTRKECDAYSEVLPNQINAPESPNCCTFHQIFFRM